MDLDPETEVVVKRSGRNILKLVLSIAAYIAASIILNSYLPELLGEFSASTAEAYSQYLPYINLVALLGFGYLIVIAFANLIYWNLRLRYPHSTARVVRNAVKIIGI